MLNNDGKLDEEEKARLEHRHLGRKERMAYVVIALLFVIALGLWVKEQYGEIPAIAFAIVGAAGIFTGAVSYEKHDRNRYGDR